MNFNPLSLSIYKIFPAWRFYGLSGPGILRLCGGSGALWGKGYMGVMCKNI